MEAQIREAAEQLCKEANRGLRRFFSLTQFWAVAAKKLREAGVSIPYLNGKPLNYDFVCHVIKADPTPVLYSRIKEYIVPPTTEERRYLYTLLEESLRPYWKGEKRLTQKTVGEICILTGFRPETIRSFYRRKLSTPAPGVAKPPESRSAGAAEDLFREAVSRAVSQVVDEALAGFASKLDAVWEAVRALQRDVDSIKSHLSRSEGKEEEAERLRDFAQELEETAARLSKLEAFARALAKAAVDSHVNAGRLADNLASILKNGTENLERPEFRLPRLTVHKDDTSPFENAGPV